MSFTLIYLPCSYVWIGVTSLTGASNHFVLKQLNGRITVTVKIGLNNFH